MLLVASLIAFHLTMTGFIIGGKRRSIFSKEYMKKEFETEHKRFFPSSEVPAGGYPDMGNGRYAAKLSYRDWFEFNSAQRIHYNYLESAACVIVFVLIGGIVYPWEAVAAGGAYIIGRVIYHIGYARQGPKGRVVGLLFF